MEQLSNQSQEPEKPLLDLNDPVIRKEIASNPQLIEDLFVLAAGDRAEKAGNDRQSAEKRARSQYREMQANSDLEVTKMAQKYEDDETQTYGSYRR